MSVVTTIGRRPSTLARWEDPTASWRVLLAGRGFQPSTRLRYVSEVEDRLKVAPRPLSMRTVTESDDAVSLEADSVVWTDVDNDAVATWAVVYLDEGSEAASPVLAVIELGEGVSMRSVAEFTVRWSGQTGRGAVYRLRTA